MKKYERPVVIVNSDLAEGVYAASGAGCYSASAWITQPPEGGRDYYVIQANSNHSPTDGHHSAQQTLVINFNQPVTYVGSQGTCVGGDGTATLRIDYSYHNNGYEYIGLGDINVKSDPGLSITSCAMYCDYGSADIGHSW